MNLWQIIDTGCLSAEDNMRFDAELLEKADSYPQPILHLYEWKKPSATYGYFARPSAFLNLESVKSMGLDLARRPTGGGIIFHLWDFAFSVLIPAHLPEYSINTLDNYAFVNRAVLSALQEYLEDNPPLLLTSQDGEALDASCHHFCMAKPTKYDVLWEGKKLVGAAQRRTKKGFLHQGSIALSLPDARYLEELLVSGSCVHEAMLQYTCPLLGSSPPASAIGEAKARLGLLLSTHLNAASLKYRSIPIAENKYTFERVKAPGMDRS